MSSNPAYSTRLTNLCLMMAWRKLKSKERTPGRSLQKDSLTVVVAEFLSALPVWRGYSDLDNYVITKPHGVQQLF